MLLSVSKVAIIISVVLHSLLSIIWPPWGKLLENSDLRPTQGGKGFDEHAIVADVVDKVDDVDDVVVADDDDDVGLL